LLRRCRGEGCLLAKFSFLEIHLGQCFDFKVEKLMCSNDVATTRNLLAWLDAVAQRIRTSGDRDENTEAFPTDFVLRELVTGNVGR